SPYIRGLLRARRTPTIPTTSNQLLARLSIMSRTKVVQLGAAGNLGTPVFDALVREQKFDITVVARTTSSFTTSDPSVKVAKIDYNDKQQLVDALRGNEIALITLGDLSTLEQNSKLIIDAAIEAGVKKVIPSEYGNDLVNPPGNQHQIFSAKLNTAAYLREKAEAGLIEYTLVTTGPFFDWGLKHEFLGFDFPNRKATIWSGGNDKINATTLDSIARTVVYLVANPKSYTNTDVRVHDFFVSQNEILAIAEEETGSKFTIDNQDIEELLKTAGAGLAKGDYSLFNIYSVVKGNVF
ncbi:14358_t:CDS:2, partial [Acaulospora colombiana]